MVEIWKVVVNVVLNGNFVVKYCLNSCVMLSRRDDIVIQVRMLILR